MPPIRAAARGRPRPAARPTAPAAPRSRRAPAGTADQRRLALGLAGVLVVSLGAILVVLYQLFLAGGSTVASTAVRAGPNIPANARRFGSLGDFERGGLPNTPFAITIGEAELNQRLQTELAKQGGQLPFQGVKATVLDDRIDFTGQVKVVGLDLPAAVAMRFFAQRGTIGYEIESINFGPVPVPGAARQALTEQIDRQLGSQKIGDQWVLDEIHAQVGAVTLVGHPK